MKRIGLLIMIFIMSLAAVACGGETSGGEVINGLKPSDVPVKYIIARIQEDQKTLYSLIEGKKDHLGFNPEQGPQNQEQIKNYQLTEWKFDNQTYYYLLEYIDPRDNKIHSEDFKIIQTKDGWKKDRYGDTPDFEQIISKLEKNKKVLRELNAK